MSYDIIIKNGKIFNGTGNPGYNGDIAIENGRIALIRPRLDLKEAKKIIDASELTICPGFIDIHSHSDYVIPISNKQESTICQGITTSVVGNCGNGMAPIPKGHEQEFIEMVKTTNSIFAHLKFPYHTYKEYLDYMDNLKNPANLIFFIGFENLIFASGLGNENRSPTPKELEKMKFYLREAMEAGAFGMSTGLTYTPQAFADTEVLIELSKVLAEYNGLYFSHIRDEGENVVDAVKEIIQIVRDSGCLGGQIAHHKISGKAFWGKSIETLSLIEQANEMGINITCDQYPYNRGMSSLPTALPPWAREGEKKEIIVRLKDINIQNKIKEDVRKDIKGWDNWIKNRGFENIYISSVNNESWNNITGKNIPQITKIKGFSDNWETFFSLLIENELGILTTIEIMNDDDIERIMKSRYQMFGTDGFGIPASFNFGSFHPRCFGSYPRVFRKYVKEKKILLIEQAIRKMTSFPAQKLGLKDRGIILEGYWADLVLLDFEMIRDTASYENPYQLPEGISTVIVNGVCVVEDGKQIRKYPGKVLLRE